MDSNEKWYTVKQFAMSFGQNPFTGKPDVMSVDTVRRRIQDGLLKALRLPSRSNRRKRVYKTLLISETERQRFIRANMTS
jgi:hypothetical protein